MHSSQTKKLTTYLEQHIIISNLCYVPFNIVMSSSQSREFPSPTILRPNFIYNIFIFLTIQQNMASLLNNPSQISVVFPSLMASFCSNCQNSPYAQTLNNNQLIFTLDQIKQLCPQVESIHGALNVFGLLQAIEHISIFQTTTTFNFLHLSVQEFPIANQITILLHQMTSCPSSNNIS